MQKIASVDLVKGAASAMGDHSPPSTRWRRAVSSGCDDVWARYSDCSACNGRQPLAHWRVKLSGWLAVEDDHKRASLGGPLRVVQSVASGLGRQVKTSGHASQRSQLFDSGVIVDVDPRRIFLREIGSHHVFVGELSVREWKGERCAASRVEKLDPWGIAMQYSKAQHDASALPPSRSGSLTPRRDASQRRRRHSLSRLCPDWGVDRIEKAASDLPLPFPYQGDQLADFYVTVIFVSGVPDEHRQHHFGLPFRELYRPSHRAMLPQAG
jgi:hypothetical protein